MSIILRTARRHVANFADECDVLKDHQQAMECRDCDAVLQLGIDAFAWLVRADERLRSAIYSGAEYDAD